MSSKTNVIWLQNNQEDVIPNEIRFHVALFDNEDTCYQFLSSLPMTSRGLTLVVTDPTVSIDRFIQLKPISSLYLLSEAVAKERVKNSSKVRGLFPDRQALINQVSSDLNRNKTSEPGFLTGIMAPFQGFHFLLTNSSTWSRALVPSILFVLILITFSTLGIWGMNALTSRLFQKHASRWASFGIWLLRIVLYIAAICLSFIIAMIAAQPMSAPALESLVRAQERDLKYPNRPEESLWSSIWRSFRVAVVSIFLSIVIFILLTIAEFFFPPAVILTTPLKLFSSALIIAYDIIDYPLSLHLFGLVERMPWFRQYFWATLGFGLAMEIIFLLPGAFLLLLPAAICGATRLVVAAERAALDQPLLVNNETI